MPEAQVTRLPWYHAEPKCAYQSSLSSSCPKDIKGGWQCELLPVTRLSSLTLYLVSVRTFKPFLTIPKLPLIASGLGKIEMLNLRLIIPQWYSEFSRAWQTWRSFWTAPCPPGRKTIFRLCQDGAWCMWSFVWRKSFCWLEQHFTNVSLVFIGCSF